MNRVIKSRFANTCGVPVKGLPQVFRREVGKGFTYNRTLMSEVRGTIFEADILSVRCRTSQPHRITGLVSNGPMTPLIKYRVAVK